MFRFAALALAPKKKAVAAVAAAAKPKATAVRGIPKAVKPATVKAASAMAKKAATEAIVKSNPVAAAVATAVSATIPKGADPHRDNVVAIFTQLSKTNHILGELHRARAYSRALQLIGEHALANPGVPLTSAEQVKHLKGIGPKLYMRIDEIIRTGTLRELSHLFSDPNMNALMDISSVHGIGPKAALRFHKLHGISTVPELRAKVEDGTIVLNAAQSIGLRYHEDLAKKIPSDECAAHGAFLTKEARKVLHKDVVVTVCGSHRRGLPFSSDIDVLISMPAEYSDNSQTSLGAAGAPLLRMPAGSDAFLETLVAHLQKGGYLLDTLALGGTKYMGICRAQGGDVARRIDIRWVAPQSYPTALFYFTGSKVFNTRIREYALGKGYSLSEYGLYKLTDVSIADVNSCTEAFRVPVLDEKEIFDTLGYPYVGPTNRTA